MIPRLRTIAVLTLLAGLSLGIFTSRALRAMGGGDPDQRPPYRLQKRIEMQLDLYRDMYNLNPQELDGVEQALRKYDRDVDTQIWLLRVENAEKFQALRDRAEASIQAVLTDARNED